MCRDAIEFCEVVLHARQAEQALGADVSRMNRSDAEEVFALIADLQGDLRDRIVVARWWLVWLLVAVQIPVSSGLTQWLIWSNEQQLWPYAAVWAGQVAVLFATIKLVLHRAGGSRTQRERFIWWIWSTFLALACAVPLIGLARGLEPFELAPVIALLAAFGFAITGATVHRLFFLGAVAFAAITAAMLFFPRYEFLIYGAGWTAVLWALAISFRPATARDADEEGRVL